MFSFFANKKQSSAEESRALYHDIAGQARNPVFYAEYGVPDTFDGRFEMLCLHLWLDMRRLKLLGQDKKAQALFDYAFKVMDQTLREMGVGDLSVPKHMKRMMIAFNGRAHAYEEGLVSKEAMEEALKRNAYGTAENPDPAMMQKLVTYIFEDIEKKDMLLKKEYHAA
jgi:cytochrome b pre-mRNA-processing protein 3